MNTIELRGGLLLREDAVLLALNLEAAGHALSVRGEQLVISDGSKLTADQRAKIKDCRLHLMALLVYEAPEAR